MLEFNITPLSRTCMLVLSHKTIAITEIPNLKAVGSCSFEMLGTGSYCGLPQTQTVTRYLRFPYREGNFLVNWANTNLWITLHDGVKVNI